MGLWGWRRNEMYVNPKKKYGDFMGDLWVRIRSKQRKQESYRERAKAGGDAVRD